MKGNILDNELVPEHIVLSEKEAEEVLEKLKIKASQLPKIFINDPALKALGQEIKPGTIIKIIRKSPTAGNAVAYRVVIEGE
ncbi:MAG: DNA-directed RNA polymerase subunit H [Candidatus Odinarchaeia archaeon]